MAKKAKPLFDDDVECAWCGKANHVKIQRKVITPATPAEIELDVRVERSQQTRLEESSQQ